MCHDVAAGTFQCYIVPRRAESTAAIDPASGPINISRGGTQCVADVADTTIVSGTGIVDERDAVHVLSQADREAGRCYACATGLPRQIVPRPRPPASQPAPARRDCSASDI